MATKEFTFKEKEGTQVFKTDLGKVKAGEPSTVFLKFIPEKEIEELIYGVSCSACTKIKYKRTKEKEFTVSITFKSKSKGMHRKSAMIYSTGNRKKCATVVIEAEIV